MKKPVMSGLLMSACFVGATLQSIAQEPLNLNYGYVSDVDSFGNVNFILTFNRPPDFFTVDQYGRPADSFQFYILTTTNRLTPFPSRPYAALIRGDEIHVARTIRVRNDGPEDTSDPNSGGWGTIRGSVPYLLSGRTLAFSIPASVLNVQGRFAYTLQFVNYGADTADDPGLSGSTLVEGATVSVLLTNDPVLKFPVHLATDGTSLFVSGGGPDNQQGIFKLPIIGGVAVKLYPAYNPLELTVIGSDVFWIDPNSGPITDTQILRAPADGRGIVTAIYTGSLVGQPIVDGSGLTTDGTTLYAADEVQGTVFRLNPDGGDLTEIGGPRYRGFFDTEHYNSLAFDSGTLYLADKGNPDFDIEEQVLALDVLGTSYNPLALGSPLVQPVGICIANGKIYLSDPVPANTLWELPIGGGTPIRLVSGAPFKQIQGMVSLKGHLYVADPGGNAIYDVALGLPDFQVTNITAVNNRAHAGSKGSKVTITATISNTGSTDAGPSTTAFMDGTTRIGLVDTPPIPAGSSVNVSIDLRAPLKNGTHRLSAVANSGDTVGESNYVNNTDAIIVSTSGTQIR